MKTPKYIVEWQEQYPATDTCEICVRCGGEYPATNEHFWPASRTDGSVKCVNYDRLGSTFRIALLCKKCSEYCKTCKMMYPATEEYFYISATGKRRLPCKRCRCQYQATRRPPRRKIKTEPIERAEQLRTYRQARYYDNIKQSRERGRRCAQRRLARMRGLPYTLTEQDWQYATEYWGHRCAVCGQEPKPGIALSFDHWIPLSSANCPGTTPDNIIPLCHATKGGKGGCNNSKQAYTPLSWLTRKFGPDFAEKKLAEIEAYFAIVRESEVRA